MKCLDKVITRHCRGEFYERDFPLFPMNKHSNKGAEINLTIFIQQSFSTLYSSPNTMQGFVQASGFLGESSSSETETRVKMKLILKIRSRTM